MTSRYFHYTVTTLFLISNWYDAHIYIYIFLNLMVKPFWRSRFVQASRARLFKEYKEVQREKVADPDIQLVCDDSNIFKWTALIKVSSVLRQTKLTCHVILFDHICPIMSVGTIRDSIWRRCIPACFRSSWAVSFATSTSQVLDKNFPSKCAFQGMKAMYDNV